MSNKDNSIPFKFPNPILDDEELFVQMWKGPFITGHIDEVFVPTREELLILLNHWAEVVREEEYFLSLQISTDWIRRRDFASHRLGFIANFLSEEEVEGVLKQVRDEERKRVEAAEVEFTE